MGYANDNGYSPATIQTLMNIVMAGVNAQFGTTYTETTFVGTNFYKFYYALIQRLQENEVKTSEIFLKLQDYFRLTNEMISRPSTTPPGLIDTFKDAGYIASIKKPIDADAGKIFVCVDVDDTAPDYATKKAQIAGILKESTVGGVVSQGTEVTTLVLSNGQSFDYKYNLPNRIEVLLRLTITLSENNQVVIKSPEEVKDILMDNIASLYQLGKNFEPQRYFTILDAPWASSILLEWSINAGVNYYSTIYDAAYDDLFDVQLANITVVEA